MNNNYYEPLLEGEDDDDIFTTPLIPYHNLVTWKQVNIFERPEHEGFQIMVRLASDMNKDASIMSILELETWRIKEDKILADEACKIDDLCRIWDKESVIMEKDFKKKVPESNISYHFIVYRNQIRKKIITLRDTLMIKAKLELIRRMEMLYKYRNNDRLCYYTIEAAKGIKVGDGGIIRLKEGIFGHGRKNIKNIQLFGTRKLKSWWKDF